MCGIEKKLEVFCTDPVRQWHDFSWQKKLREGDTIRLKNVIETACGELGKARNCVFYWRYLYELMAPNTDVRPTLNGYAFEGWDRVSDNLLNIAAMEVVICYYHFQEVLKILVGEFDKFRPALESFKRNHPKIEVARHALAHRAELSLNPAKNGLIAPRSKDGIVKKTRSPLQMTNCIRNEYVVVTRKGEFIEINASIDGYISAHESLIQIFKICDALFE